MINKDNPNHEKIVKTTIGVYEKFAVSLVPLAYASLRKSGCSVCEFHTLFIQQKNFFLGVGIPITIRTTLFNCLV